MTEDKRAERLRRIDKIGEILFQMRDTASTLATSGGAYYGARQADIRAAMILLELKEINTNLSALLDEMKK